MSLSRLFRAILCVLAFFWLTHNIRPIPPGSQAIVTRFGSVVRVQQDGVLVAWPPPLEHVVVLPVGERRLLQSEPAGNEQADETADVLTGDGNMVRLDGRFAWRVTGPGTGMAAAQAAPALSALFRQDAVSVAARHRLGDFIGAAGGGRQDAAVREVAALISAQLDALGAGLDISSAAVTAALPVEVQGAADVAEARARTAEAALAAARSEAAQRLQQTDRERDRIFGNAHAEAAERVAFARSSTATLMALEARMNQATRPALLADLYRERIAGILRQAGSVSTVDPKSVSKVVIPDGGP